MAQPAEPPPTTMMRDRCPRGFSVRSEIHDVVIQSARHPEVEVFLVELERTEQVVALREGRIHVGIYPDLSTPRDRQFQSQVVFACPMVAVLPPKHPQAGMGHEEDDLDIHLLSHDTVLKLNASVFLTHKWDMLSLFSNRRCARHSRSDPAREFAVPFSSLSLK
jgi:DNA-binding transcriptional LysR family regulator